MKADWLNKTLFDRRKLYYKKGLNEPKEHYDENEVKEVETLEEANLRGSYLIIQEGFYNQMAIYGGTFLRTNKKGEGLQ